MGLSQARLVVVAPQLQRLPAAVPGFGEFGDEFLEVVEFAHGQAQQGDVGGCFFGVTKGRGFG